MEENTRDATTRFIKIFDRVQDNHTGQYLLHDKGLNTRSQFDAHRTKSNETDIGRKCYRHRDDRYQVTKNASITDGCYVL